MFGGVLVKVLEDSDDVTLGAAYLLQDGWDGLGDLGRELAEAHACLYLNSVIDLHSVDQRRVYLLHPILHRHVHQHDGHLLAGGS